MAREDAARDGDMRYGNQPMRPDVAAFVNETHARAMQPFSQM